jgi:hypothetical protein
VIPVVGITVQFAADLRESEFELVAEGSCLGVASRQARDEALDVGFGADGGSDEEYREGASCLGLAKNEDLKGLGGECASPTDDR